MPVRGVGGSGHPVLSVVITAYNRAESAKVAIDSVRALDVPGGVEVIVVDDGSEPDVAAQLDGAAGPDVRVLHQENLGLCGARVRGADAALGDWLVFLDDDDQLLEGWSELLELMRGDDVAIVSGAARLRRPDGSILRDLPPEDLGSVFSGVTAQYLPGCFAVRRTVYERAGGYLPGLSSWHQSELFIRLAAVSHEMGLTALHTPTPVLEMERREETDRPLSNPRLLYDGTRWILARHAERFRTDRELWRNWEAVAALNAVRLGELPAARRHALRALRLVPTDWRSWARVVAVSTPLARRRWGRAGEFIAPNPSQRAPLAHAASFLGHPAAHRCTVADLLFLPWRYRENPPASADADGTPYWEGGTETNDVRYQDPVYRWAARLVRGSSPLVLDVGCGSGHKLVRHVRPVAGRTVGVDQESAIRIARDDFPDGEWLSADLGDPAAWEQLRQLRPGFVICADVIEHLRDPAALLRGLRTLVGPEGSVLLSTPDRLRLEDNDPLGPPRNPRHVREWSESELRLLVESAGFEPVEVRRLLPRAYSPTVLEAKRLVHRALHRRAVPDRRSNLALLLRPATRAA